jgi:hypothetical protein
MRGGRQQRRQGGLQAGPTTQNQKDGTDSRQVSNSSRVFMKMQDYPAPNKGSLPTTLNAKIGKEKSQINYFSFDL